MITSFNNSLDGLKTAESLIFRNTISTHSKNSLNQNKTSKDFIRTVTDCKIGKILYSANAKAIKMKDRMAGEIIDLTG